MAAQAARWFVVSALLVLAATAVTAQGPDNETTGPAKEAHVSCRVHVVNNTEVQATEKRTQSSVKVLQAAEIMDIAVVVQLQHPDVAALQVSLTASSTTGGHATVVLKRPNLSIRGGSNMVQTIFSDYAPADFPQSASDAPYSAVYRPAEALDALARGNHTLAAKGGSKGVWTLSVVDARDGDSRSLKLTGWELWLCGDAAGPLFQPGASPAPIRTFSGPQGTREVNVVQKTVEPKKGDVKAVLERGEAMAPEEKFKVVLAKVNERLGQQFLDKAQNLVAGNPQMAAHLQKALENFSGSVHKLPAALGYTLGEAGWDLVSPDLMSEQFLDTVKRCYEDLYWCWKNTGLSGSLSLELANSWGERTGPLMAEFENAYKAWVNNKAALEERNPELARWSDVLFYSAIDGLYDAALLNAVYSVGETYFQTAVRLAIYLTPVRFDFNLRALVVDLYNLITGVLDVVFAGFINTQAFVVDGEINNSINYVVVLAKAMLTEVKQVLEVTTEGLAARAQMAGNRADLSGNALLKSAEMLNDQFVNVMSSINPAFGALYDTRVASPLRDVNSVMRQTQKSVGDYFREQNDMQALANTVNNNFDILGNITMTLVNRTADAFLSVEKALDPLIPGPPPSEVLFQLGVQVTGIISDATAALNSLVPVEELQAAGDILQATTDTLLAKLATAIQTVENALPRENVTKTVGQITKNLQGLQKDAAYFYDQLINRFPGPVINSTFGVLRNEAEAAAREIRGILDSLATEYPNLQVPTVINNVQAVLEELLSGAEGPLKVAITAVTNPADTAEQLATGLPDAFGVVAQAIEQGPMPPKPKEDGKISPEDQKLAEQLQKELGATLKTFSDRVNNLAQRVNPIPPVKSMNSYITEQISKEASQLAAVADAMPKEDGALTRAMKDSSLRLQQVLNDISSQEPLVPSLLKSMTPTSLRTAVDSLNATADKLENQVNATVQRLEPVIPDIRGLLDSLLSPAIAGLRGAIKQASGASVQLLNATSQGLVQASEDGLDALSAALIQAEQQLAKAFQGFADAADAAQAAASNASGKAIPAANAIADQLAAVGKNANAQLAAQLEALRPPADVLYAVLRPIGSILDPVVGNLNNATLTAIPRIRASLEELFARLAAVGGTIQSDLGKLIVSGPFGGAQLTSPQEILGETARAVQTALMDIGRNATMLLTAAPAAQAENNVRTAFSGLADSLSTVRSGLEAASVAMPQNGPVLKALLGHRGGKSLTEVLQSSISSLQALTTQPLSQQTQGLQKVLADLLGLVPRQASSIQLPELQNDTLVRAAETHLANFVKSMGMGLSAGTAFVNGFKQGVQQSGPTMG